MAEAIDRIALSGLRIQAGDRVLVHDVHLTLQAGEVLALVGASGAGKTLTARSLLGLVDLQPGVVHAELEIQVDGLSLQPWHGLIGGDRAARDSAFTGIRGDILALLPQDARAALDPFRRVRWHLEHAVPPGLEVDVEDCLRRAGLNDVDRVASLWPHELSGGMAQRVGIAQILARQSRFIVADEPTGGLDVLAVRDLCAEFRKLADAGIGVLLVTHDLRILPGLADRVMLMDAGRVVEELTSVNLASATSAVGQRLVAATRRIAGRRLR